MTKKKLSDELYSGEATFGRINAIISAIVITVICIVMIIIGITLLVHKSHLKKIEGTCTGDSQCKKSTNCDDKNNCHTAYSCTTPVQYTVNGKVYMKSLSTGDSSYKKGDPITFYYEPSDPSVIESSPVPTWMGWLLIGLAILFLFAAWSWVYVTRKSKLAAAVGGTAATVGIFKNALK
jgi:hypothetical protein